jgi:hypothetical protein
MKNIGLAIGLVMLSLGLSAGCGSDDPPSPAEQCRALLSKTCGRMVQCLVDNGTITQADAAANKTACIDAAASVADCSRAVAVGSSYSTCMSELDSADCAALTGATAQLPPSCQGVIQTN